MQVLENNSSEQKWSRGTNTTWYSFVEILVLLIPQFQPTAIDQCHRGSEDINGLQKPSIFLTISSSFLGGELPVDNGIVEFDGFQSLRLLDLSSCQLTGEIPVWLSKLKKLEILILNSNRITGSIHSWLGTLARLISINLGSNQISGEFPNQLCRLPMLVPERAAYLCHTGRWKCHTVQFSVLVSSKDLYIQQQLKWKYTFWNRPINCIIFMSCILASTTFRATFQTKYLFLQTWRYWISPGTICLEKFQPHWHSLTCGEFLISRTINNLEGPITTSIQFQSFGASAFEGNPRLCGALLQNECRPIKVIDGDDKINKQDVENEHQNQNPWSYVSIVVGFIIGFWECVVLWCLRRHGDICILSIPR